MLPDPALAAAVVAALKEKGMTLACAESCTGGWFAKTVVDVPGASEVFLGGVVSYVDRVKAALLGVGEETLARYSAVSEPVAREMAEGARRALGSDLAVSVTGLAGPGGGTAETPVGCVYIGLATPAGTTVTRYVFQGDRSGVRSAAVDGMLRLILKKLS